MSTFQTRVKRCMRLGDLTVADLRVWFKRPYATVWRWVHSGWEPGLSGQRKARNASGKQAERDLVLLERAVASDRWFPVPLDVGGQRRPNYMKDAHYAAERARLPAAHTAK